MPLLVSCPLRQELTEESQREQRHPEDAFGVLQQLAQQLPEPPPRGYAW